MLIRTKRQYYDLARLGLAGNAPLTWDTAEEFLASSNDAAVGIRMLNNGSGKFHALVKRDRIKSVISREGLRHGEYVISKTILPSEVRLSGELTWFEGQWVFYHSFMRKPMREALREDGRHAYGMEAWAILKQHGTPADIEDLQNLFDTYTCINSHPVIELTVTMSDCGIFLHRNILIWEVRHY